MTDQEAAERAIAEIRGQCSVPGGVELFADSLGFILVVHRLKDLGFTISRTAIVDGRHVSQFNETIEELMAAPLPSTEET